MLKNNGYVLTSDPSRSHLRLSLEGFLSVDDLDRLEHDFDIEIEHLEASGHPRGTYLTLVAGCFNSINLSTPDARSAMIERRKWL